MFRRAIIISSLILSLAGPAALAQSGQARAQRREKLQLRRETRRENQLDRRLQRLQQRLGLSASQVNAMRALEENRQKEIEAAQQERQQKRQEINQRFANGLKDILTPDQLQKLPKNFQR